MPAMSSRSTILALLRDPRFIVAFGFVLGGVFVYLTVRGIDWAEVRSQLAGISLLAVLLALAGTLVSAFLRSLRWRLLFVTERVAVLRLFTVEMASLGLNNVSPVRLLDEPAILTMLTLRDKIPAPTVLATVLTTRVQDLALTLAFVAAAIALEPAIADRAGPALYLSGVFVFFLIGLLNLGRLARRFKVIGRIPGILAYGKAVEEVLRHKPRLLATSSLTIVYWLLLGPSAWVLANGMGVEINLYQATIVALGAIFFATSVPGLPGAFGTFELAVQEMLAVWSVPRELGFGFGLVLHLLLFLPPIVFGLVVLPREGVGVLQSWRRIVGGASDEPDASLHTETPKRPEH